MTDLHRDIIEAANAGSPELAMRAALAIREDGGEYRPAYNGHVNRETWNASLWIDNDQDTYNAARAILADACAGSDYDTRGVYSREDDRRYQLRTAGDALREWFEERYSPRDSAGPLMDAWRYAVACVDWLAIAEGLAETMDPDPTEHPNGYARLIADAAEGDPGEANEPPLHPAAVLTGGNVPQHYAGAYPRLSCCGGPVELVEAVQR